MTVYCQNKLFSTKKRLLSKKNDILMILIDVLLFKDPEPGGQKVSDPLDPEHCAEPLITVNIGLRIICDEMFR